MKKIKIVMLLVAFFACNSLKAQDEYRTPLPTVMEMSPNVAAMAQYVDYPVSHYSGVPNTNLPLYEVDIYGYKLPISLSYHASGIRVNQEASWVGLGWSLNVGGMISRTIKCTDDLYYMDHSNGLSFEGYYKGPEIAGQNIMPPYEYEYDSPFYQMYGAGGNILLKVDTEPDIFYYSFPEASGKFIIDKSRGIVVFDKKDNIKIELKNRYTNSQRSYYFTVTSSDGTIYVFDRDETTRTYSNANTSLNKNYTIPNVLERSVGSRGQYTSAWNLTKIILPNKKEILFQYAKETTTTPIQESLQTYYGIDGSLRNIIQYDCNYAMGGRYSVSKSECISYRLTKIQWDGGYIDFIPLDRFDLKGTAKALSSIKVYNKLNRIIKQFDFTYSYINNSYYGQTDKEYLYMRLKLDKVKDYYLNRGYDFSYFGGTMPAKNSKNVDYWGYHNGKLYGANYCAKVNYWPNDLPGVIKSSNMDYMKIGTLNNIKLPTGGNIAFEYEPNTFDNTSWSFDNSGSGGGLRVKKITSEGKTRNFSYYGGKLLVEPVLFYLDVICPPGGRIRSPNAVVQLSEPKLPVSSFSTGNIVGYDKVEEYVTDGTNTSKTTYEFYNETEQEWYEEMKINVPTMTVYNNGLPKSVTHYSNNQMVEKTEYRYTSTSSQRVAAFHWDNAFFSTFSYYYQPVWYQKSQEIIRKPALSQGTEMVTTRNFGYNNRLLLSSSGLAINADQSQEQRFFYATDFTDAVSQAMVDSNLVGIPIEMIELRNGNVVFGKKTKYKQVNNMFLPDIVQELNVNEPRTINNYSSFYNPQVYFDTYNSYGKPVEVRDNAISIIYLWGYNSSYPIAEIRNTTYEHFKTAMGGITVINNIEGKTEPSLSDWQTIDALRSHSLLKNASITTHKYIPLVGVTETTDPRGFTTYYDYDSSGRLKEVYFNEGTTKRVIESYQYNYKQ
ncbi:hypothetical protein LJC29_03330 [Bacteroides sp. OttesenSCG-928-N06]|nr:hypothetical protein [Bacteroides sp. OttesenSCG-928-N06]